jgi:hypothetical protein
MRIVKDTLSVLVEEWSDPGDYPSGAGSGPLPSYKYVAGMEGELVIELTAEEMVVFRQSSEDESLDFWVNEVLDYEGKHPEVSSMTWEVESVVKCESGRRHHVTLIVAEVEANPDYGVDDYEPDCDY